ncbi:MAG TPA: zf-HC2 domain-containing protein [Gaiellaceae bacterium]|nr:zf-HC2 domain-containing protein [Gaiellaceae bacterium]
MSAAYPQTVCVRVREQVSLELDGELSQLEQRMLGTHLERCAPCAAYAVDVRDFTERMRTSPRALMERPVVVRRRSPLTTVRLQVGVAAAFALAALGLGTQLAVAPAESSSLARFEGQPSLSPSREVVEQEQAILRVVRAGRPLPPRGSVI